MQRQKTYGKCILNVKEANLKRLHTMWFQLSEIPEKENLEAEKRSVVARDLWGRQDEWVELEWEGLLGQWNYSLWSYYDGYMALCIHQNSELYNTKGESWCKLWTLVNNANLKIKGQTKRLHAFTGDSKEFGKLSSGRNLNSF